MPGILPMKIIKVGASHSQSRIAQACDRCRSKKIRCDGIRPCCTQCSNVGFECKTSDKLSRRAFPRGYTESLEERVRLAEAELREAKDLLDEKDEKLDILSKMNSNRRPSMSSRSTSPTAKSRKERSPPRDDIFRIEAAPLLLEGDHSDSYYIGASSGRAFVDSLKRNVQAKGRWLGGFDTEAFFKPQKDSSNSSPTITPAPNLTPPRLFSDKCINVFFQEWAPLFPVIHKHNFLHLYDEYLFNPEQVKDQSKLAQLHLVFSIAGLSTDNPDKEQISLCEIQWRTALDSILMENTLSTLQCLILALIYCIQKADYTRLQHYKGIAVALSYRLGLNQSQRRFSFGTLTTEMRQRSFWTLYTVDCFSASLLGLPKLLKEDDIYTEYPSDVDDEHVTEEGYKPMPPGEPTRISSALALFRCSRILSKVLDQIYPAAAIHDLSLQTLTTLETELNEWSDNLPTHLKLTFAQDKPSTDITGSRSALLSVAYYYIRSLIHRPAVGSTLGVKSVPSMICLGESSKHLVQITQLLEERNMTFSFCLNKNSMLILCGLGSLYYSLDLKQESRLMQDCRRLVNTVVRFLEKANAPGSADFKKLASSLINLDSQSLENKATSALLRASTAMSAPKVMNATPFSSFMSRKKPQQPLYKHTSASMSADDIAAQQEKLRRASLSNPSAHTSQNQTSSARSSYEGTSTESLTFRRGNRYSLSQLPSVPKPQFNAGSKPLNLDYLSLSNTPLSSQPSSPTISRTAHPGPVPHKPHLMCPKANNQFASELGSILDSIENGHVNIYNATYGGPAPIFTTPNQTVVSNPVCNDWSSAVWDDMAYEIMHDPSAVPGPAQSVFSSSGDSHSSGDDISTDLGMGGTAPFAPEPHVDFLLPELNFGNTQ